MEDKDDSLKQENSNGAIKAQDDTERHLEPKNADEDECIEEVFDNSKKTSVVDPSDKLSINMGYCFAYCAVWGLGTWQTAWALGGNGNTTAIFAAKLDWDKDDTIFYNTIISSAAIVGIAIGSLAGGKLLQYGRRKPVIIAQLICILAAFISMFLHVSTLTIGRLLLGIGAGF